MNIYQLAKTFRAALLRGEQAQAAQMIQQYGEVYATISQQLARLTTRLEEARKTGLVRQSWLYEQERLQSLQQQARAQMNRFGAFAVSSVTEQQRQAVSLAQEHARQLALQGLQDTGQAGVSSAWNRIPTGAVEHLVGTLQDGSPLNALFSTFGERAAESIKRVLVNGVATGQGPREIARGFRKDMGGDLTRSLTVSRTEVLRSYREASIESYRQNDDVVQGWIWQASLSPRTCAMCIAMHGKEFPLDVPFASHPNCRCSPIPLTVGWEALGLDGLDDTRVRQPTGEEWFEKQSEETQQKVLGPGKFEAWRDGKIGLSDLVGYRDDPQWGPGRFEKSLKSLTEGGH